MSPELGELVAVRPAPPASPDRENPMTYVGPDVHTRSVVACVLDAQGRRHGRHEVAHTRAALERFAREILRPDDAVALEGTTNTWAVVAVPRPNVGRAAVGNAMKIRATLVCDRSRVKYRIQSLPDWTAPGSGRAFRARRRPSRPLTRLRTE